MVVKEVVLDQQLSPLRCTSSHLCGVSSDLNPIGQTRGWWVQNKTLTMTCLYLIHLSIIGWKLDVGKFIIIVRIGLVKYCHSEIFNKTCHLLCWNYNENT